MNLIFVSNYLNHHQFAFCNCMQKLCEEFYFISTDCDDTGSFQKNMDAEYVLYYQKDKEYILKLIINADVVIFGSCPNNLIQMRMKVNKLSFLYTERFFKKGVWRRFIPRTRKKVMERIGDYKNKNMYVLCASAYTSYDLSLVGYPVEKCFKWGYFPEIKYYEDINNLSAEKEEASILWVGRFLSWKHPEVAIYVAKYLKKKGYRFKLRMIGSGDLEKKLRKQILEFHLEDCVELLGSMNPKQVRKYMEKSQIFLFTSDFYEGWGAVLNEAMNSACAVVASHAIGATPYLIENKLSGLVYKNGYLMDACLKVQNLLDDSLLQKKIGRNSYQVLTSLWNANEAAERIVKLAQTLLADGNIENMYENGPCSCAYVLKNR